MFFAGSKYSKADNVRRESDPAARYSTYQATPNRDSLESKPRDASTMKTSIAGSAKQPEDVSGPAAGKSGEPTAKSAGGYGIIENSLRSPSDSEYADYDGNNKASKGTRKTSDLASEEDLGPIQKRALYDGTAPSGATGIANESQPNAAANATEPSKPKDVPASDRMAQNTDMEPKNRDDITKNNQNESGVPRGSSEHSEHFKPMEKDDHYELPEGGVVGTARHTAASSGTQNESGVPRGSSEHSEHFKPMEKDDHYELPEGGVVGTARHTAVSSGTQNESGVPRGSSEHSEHFKPMEKDDNYELPEGGVVGTARHTAVSGSINEGNEEHNGAVQGKKNQELF